MPTGVMRRTTIGSYRVVDFLGAGGMGEVYRGVHLTTGRVAAVKMLTASARTPAMVERFRNEGRIQSALTHPNIVALYDFFEFEGVPCIAMEYVSGESLDQVLARGPLDAALALAWFAQVTDAVGYVHQRGIVHRDLKSNNIKVDEQGRVKLLDFGIAKSGDSPKLTTDGSVVGTLHYLSPEQVRGSPATPASDIWALGVVLYEMATGRVPFASESLTGVMARILKGTYDPPHRDGTAVSAGITRIIARCLKVNPDQRYSSAEALLTDVRAQLTPAPRLPTPVQRSSGEVLSFVRQRWALLASIAAAAASVIFLITTLSTCCAPPPLRPPQGPDTVAQQIPDTGAKASAAAAANPVAELRPVTIKVFGDVPAEVWRDGMRVGVTPFTFSARVGEWIRITLKHPGHEQIIRPFQVSAVSNEYAYTLAGEPPPQAGPTGALP